MERLIKVQQNLKCSKNQRNTFGGYNYRSCEDILEAVKPLLADQKLSLVLSDDIVLIGDRFYVKATATVYDSTGKVIASNTGWAREDELRKGMTGDQLTGASSSYARKYALNGLFAIDDTKDSDATNDAVKEPKQAPKPTPKVEPKTETSVKVNDPNGPYTFEQFERLESYGFNIAQVVVKLNKKSTSEITFAEMEQVLQKCEANRLKKEYEGKK